MTAPAERDATPRALIWLTIVMIMGAVAVAQAFGRFTWGLVLPSARDDLLGGSNTIAGFFGTLNVTAYLLGTLLVAWASSKVSLIGLMRIGLIVSISALGLAAFTPNAALLGLALFAMGIGGAIIWIPAPAIASRVLPPERVGQAIGFIGSGIGLGIVTAGQLSNRLADPVPEDPSTGVLVYDTWASDLALWQRVYRVELGIALVVLVLVFTLLRSVGDRPSGGGGGFGGFGALRTVRGWVPLTIAYASFGFAYILVIAFLVARLEDDAGFTPDEAAAMFSLLGVATVLGGATLGPLSDRIGRRITITGAFIIFAACTLLLLTGSQPWVAIAVFGVGMMFSGAPSLITAHVVDNTTPETYGPAFSAATLAFGVTQMISPQIGGAIADFAGSFTPVFILSAVVSCIGALASSRLPD